MHVLFGKTDLSYPCPHQCTIFFKDSLPLVGVDEIFDLHLLKLTHAEDEVARSDLITKCLTDLCQAERQAWMERVDNVLVVHKHTAGSFRTQVRHCRSIVGRTHLCLEHHVELAHIAQE